MTLNCPDSNCNWSNYLVTNLTSQICALPPPEPIKGQRAQSRSLKKKNLQRAVDHTVKIYLSVSGGVGGCISSWGCGVTEPFSGWRWLIVPCVISERWNTKHPVFTAKKDWHMNIKWVIITVNVANCKKYLSLPLSENMIMALIFRMDGWIDALHLL